MNLSSSLVFLYVKDTVGFLEAFFWKYYFWILLLFLFYNIGLPYTPNRESIPTRRMLLYFNSSREWMQTGSRSQDLLLLLWAWFGYLQSKSFNIALSCLSWVERQLWICHAMHLVVPSKMILQYLQAATTLLPMRHNGFALMKPGRIKT